MLSRIKLIMFDTFLDVARHKMLIIHVVFLSICLGLFNLFGHFSTTPALEYRMIQDVGLSIISLFGLLIALFIGSTTLRDELHRKTAYAILTLPMRRWELFTGKFLGTLLAAAVNMFIMLGFLTLLLYIKFGVIWKGFHWVVIFMLFEFSIMSGLVLLFSLADSLILCFSLSIFTVMLGNMSDHIMHLTVEADIAWLSWIVKIIYFFIPNFGYFNIKHKILKDLAISPQFAGWAAAYTAFYLFFLLVIGSWMLEKKDL